LGTLLILLEKNQFTRYNKSVWICKNSMAFAKKYCILNSFFAGNSIKLPKNILAKKKWVTNSHSRQ
jgi:hypothetical protein